MNWVEELLRLEVRDFVDLTRWRWALIDEADGSEVAANDVRLDTADWQFEASADLYQYLSWHVAPDRRGTDDARIVGEVGEWIASQVLGPVADTLAQRAMQHHVTVRVVAPADAAGLLLLPLELAHANGRPFAGQGITLVMQPGADSAAYGAPAPRARLRVLGLFSMPEGGQPLNLHRERQALVTLIRRAAEDGKTADVHVLQYGVTRDLLRDALADDEGWDVIHISGHGAPGELLLETADGKPDRVTAVTLADLLMAAREHVRLVTVTTCSSAAASVADQRRRLDLPMAGRPAAAHGTRPPDAERPHPPATPSAPSGTLATELADRLDCAVLAMRYPVDDEFATAFAATLYDLLANKGRPLPQAVGLTLRQLSDDGAFPVLSLATPALFGGTAVDLSLALPDRGDPADHDAGRPELPGFPPEPERFVGRVSVMARCSAALALRSGVPGVLLHGMPGGGKTACALELAYGHEHAFDWLVWYKAPDEGMAINGALTDFAFTLEQYLPAFQMLDVLVSDAALAGFLPELTHLMDQRRVLLVIDNAESLISEGGEWRDARWGQVIGALSAHHGTGRVVLTSRRMPTGLTGLRVGAVDALSPDETLLLVRELPHLNALMHGRIPGIEGWMARGLAHRAIEAARGHPKLLELADGQAAHPDQLAVLVAAGDHAWRERGGLPHGFFATDEETASESEPVAAADYWHVLATWTGSVADTLAPGERDLFWFLCCLEEPDRQRSVLAANWAGLWQRLSRDGEPPDLDQALAAVSATTLITTRPVTDGTDEAHPVHPGVAEAGRSHAGQPFRDAADTLAAGFWDAVHQRASGQASGGSVDTGLLVRAGLAAVPYLLRQHQWDHAARLIEAAFVRDPSRANAAAALPAIEQITRREPRWAGVLAKVVTVTDPDDAVTRLRAAMADAVTRGDYRTASANAGRLLDLCRNTGRLAEALDAAEQKAGYTRQAGLGPWDQLADEIWRLQVLATMGHADQVLDEFTRLRDRMATLPATPSPGNGEAPWHVREALLDTGRYAAMLLGRHADALPLIAEVAASQRGRHAPAAIIARTQYNNYFPLLHLGRTDEALAVLQECRQVFQEARDTLMLGRTLSSLADVEKTRGHGDAAVRLEHDALRWKYLAGDVEGIAISYHNLGNHLANLGRQPGRAFVSHLTSAFVCTLTGNNDIAESVEAAATDLRGFGAHDAPPADVADLCRHVSEISGTDLPALIEQFCPDPEIAEQALHDLIAQAQELAS